ncbi:probable transcription factor At1g11510 [Rhodamnia argentea]|uniref:Probable transcription factor At1g11510 n=1 Tax=Rhodamnia argentea TaxID=178133 RepID=A0A8B8P2U6_9MYRT|nr:probable transcription factor At1g11510 [Rhodamnia argentea]
MAPKRPLPSEDPPPASSDEESSSSTEDEEEEEKQESGESEAGSGSDTDDEDDKEEQKRPSQPKLSSPPPPPPQQQKSQGRSGSKTESESESETESESESGTRQYTVKPIASKPMEEIETPPAKKQRPEPPSSSKQPSAKRKIQVEEEQSPAKRKVEVEDSKESKDSKKGKKKDVAENGSLQKPGEESKKPMFHRIWGDDDEVALLQGMIDFREKKGVDPTANTNAFHHYVKKSLGQEFTASQLANKIRVLKKKYSNNEGKGKDGGDRAFSKPHEEKVFQLSKKIWGFNKSNDAGGRGEQTPMPKANGTAKKSKTAGTSSKSKLEASKLEAWQERPKENGGLISFENSDTIGMLSCDKMLQLSGIGLDGDFLSKGWEMVDELKKEEFKEKRRKLQLAEMRVLAERAELIQCQTNLILEAHHQATGK